VKDAIPLVVAAIAALTALAGYLLNGAANRRIERGKRYADALDAVEQYRKLPFTFLRRHDGTAARRDELATMLGEVQIALAFHRRWLWLDAPHVGAAYDDLVSKIREKNSTYRKHALGQPTPQNDVDIEIGKPYAFSDKKERMDCVTAMKGELRLSRNPW
jgi:hypothetical protein